MPPSETRLSESEPIEQAAKEDVSNQEAAKKIIDVYETVIDTFIHGSKEFRLEPCSTPYHDREHTENVFMTASDICHAKRKAGEKIGNKDYQLVMTAAALHDIGYLKDSYPEDREKREGGARHRDIHYIRSAVVAEEILGSLGWEEKDAKAVRDIILINDNPGLAGKERFSPEAERLYEILRLGDLLGQAADPQYPTKVYLLYQELIEARPDLPSYGWNPKLFFQETFFMRQAIIKETEEERKHLREAGIDYYDDWLFRNLATREREQINEELTGAYIEKELARILDSLEVSGLKIRTAIVKSSALTGGGRWAEIDTENAHGWDIDILIISDNTPLHKDAGLIPYRSPSEAVTAKGSPQATKLEWKNLGNCIKVTRAEEPEIPSQSPFRGPDCLIFTTDQLTRSIGEGNEREAELLKEALGKGLIIAGELPEEIASLAEEKIAPRDLWDLVRDEKFIAQREAPIRAIFRTPATTPREKQII